jgi:hypothetical protein
MTPVCAGGVDRLGFRYLFGSAMNFDRQPELQK